MIDECLDTLPTQTECQCQGGGGCWSCDVRRKLNEMRNRAISVEDKAARYADLCK